MEWQTLRLAQWLLTTADDLGPLGKRPAPVVTPMPKNFQMPTGGLSRPWHRQRPKAKTEQVAA